MSTADIRQKLHHYIENAQEKKLKAIFAMMEDEIENDDVIWTDKFVTELNKRTSDFEKGKVKGRTWADIKKEAKRLIKSA